MMFRHPYEYYHMESEFLQLAADCRMLDLIATYRSRGLHFCYLTGPFLGLSTGYNRDFVDQPDLSEGIVFILSE